MAKETCKLFIRKATPAGKIPLGSGSRQAAISPTKQVLAFGTLELLGGSHVDCMSIQATEKLGQEGMIEWNRICRLFLFSGILRQSCEVHPKFRNEMNSGKCPFHFPPGISEIFGRMESALNNTTTRITSIYNIHNKLYHLNT